MFDSEYYWQGREDNVTFKVIIKEIFETEFICCFASMTHFDAKALYLALDERRRSRHMSWLQVQKEIAQPGSKHRISASTIRNTETGRTSEADGILAMVRWLGMRFQDFSVGVKDPVPSSPLEEGDGMRRFDARAFYSALNKERQRMDLSWKEFTEQKFPGWSPSMLTGLAEGGRMSASKVVALSAWLHRSPESFTHFVRH